MDISKSRINDNRTHSDVSAGKGDSSTADGGQVKAVSQHSTANKRSKRNVDTKNSRVFTNSNHTGDGNRTANNDVIDYRNNNNHTHINSSHTDKSHNTTKTADKKKKHVQGSSFEPAFMRQLSDDDALVHHYRSHCKLKRYSGLPMTSEEARESCRQLAAEAKANKYMLTFASEIKSRVQQAFSVIGLEWNDVDSVSPKH